MRRLSGVVFALLLTIPALSQNNSEQTEYLAAASKPQPPERVTALEKFLAAHPQSSLKLDALELLVWNSRTGASLTDLEHWTSQLAALAPENPLAAAVIVGNSLPIANPLPPADRARNALPALDHFDRPEGLSHEDFRAMKDFVIATLNGVVGYSYFEQKDFASARTYLRKSVERFPDNAQLTYTLALSDFEGSRDDQAEGFRYLARSVNLTRGTPAADSLAQFARQKYRDVGGTDADWDKYLAATPVAPRVTPSQATTVAAQTAAPANTQPTVTASTAPNPALSEPPNSATNSSSNSPAPTSTTNSAAATSITTPSSPTASAAANHSSPSAPTSAVKSAPANATNNEVAVATPPPPPPPNEPTYRVMPPHRIPQLVPGAPMSIGLLIQSALAQKQSRQPIVFSLTDMVRRLRNYDEAFVMSFNKDMDFQQDLTSNDKALESAMDEIAPAPGSTVYAAVTFAAGHLNRIARNPNRVLIVIAGEGDRSSAVSPLELSSQLNVSGVRIYCIGVNVFSQSDQSRLQQLAAYTGGRAFFLAGPDQVRSAIRSISGDLGISFPN